ncbi:hypothetical protein [Kitasatospora sp. NPDC057223]|uniref:hypothetical protein n=1 Tax=Kitasatospora sp. NPDC057223 TaxID=3346055 RepID=UPI003643415C
MPHFAGCGCTGGLVEEEEPWMRVVAELTACAAAQPAGASVWWLPAGAALPAVEYADAAELYAFDLETAAGHPAVLAEEEVLKAVTERAPRTAAARSLLIDAELAVWASARNGRA